MSCSGRIGRASGAFVAFDAYHRQLTRRIMADQDDADAPLFEAVENAARAVVAAPATTPSDVRRKIEVLRRWYFADLFNEPTLADDAAAGALRHVLADVLAHLPE